MKKIFVLSMIVLILAGCGSPEVVYVEVTPRPDVIQPTAIPTARPTARPTATPTEIASCLNEDILVYAMEEVLPHLYPVRFSPDTNSNTVWNREFDWEDERDALSLVIQTDSNGCIIGIASIVLFDMNNANSYAGANLAIGGLITNYEDIQAEWLEENLLACAFGDVEEEKFIGNEWWQFGCTASDIKGSYVIGNSVRFE